MRILSKRVMAVASAFAAATALAGNVYPPARFTDPDRIRKIEAAFPQIDEIFRAFADQEKIPGMVWGRPVSTVPASAARLAPFQAAAMNFRMWGSANRRTRALDSTPAVKMSTRPRLTRSMSSIQSRVLWAGAGGT
jgi:hypothetical protein